MVSDKEYITLIKGAAGASARKGETMVFKIILIIIAFVMLCGMVADESRYNKRTYCIGFVACIIARAILEGGLF